MTLTKNRMVSEIGRRTRLKNRDVQLMLETLMEVWADELASGGKIELENFFVLEVQMVDQSTRGGIFNEIELPGHTQQLSLRVSKHLKRRIKLVSP